LDDLHKIFSGCQLMAKVPNAVEIGPIAENLNRLSRAHERYRRQTDNGRTGDSIIVNVNVSSRSRSLKIKRDR